MSIEAPAKPTPETQSPSAEQIREAFVDAQSVVYKLSADPRFQARCLEQGINPNNDFETATYWDAFADYAGKVVARVREQHGNSLRISAFELAATAPSYIHAQTTLDRLKAERGATGRLSAPEQMKMNTDKRTASRFNGMIRTFAEDFPQATPHDVSVGLANIANKTIGSPRQLREGVQNINITIRGAQHELAFGQILAHTGRIFHSASINEDLAGTDYILHNPDGTTLGIDAKASLATQESRGNFNQAYSWDNSGQLVMFSLVQDSEFRNSFFIDDQLAASRAPALNQLIDQATGVQTQAI